jgi:hypothetical protein
VNIRCECCGLHSFHIQNQTCNKKLFVSAILAVVPAKKGLQSAIQIERHCALVVVQSIRAVRCGETRSFFFFFFFFFCWARFYPNLKKKKKKKTWWRINVKNICSCVPRVRIVHKRAIILDDERAVLNETTKQRRAPWAAL